VGWDGVILHIHTNTTLKLGLSIENRSCCVSFEVHRGLSRGRDRVVKGSKKRTIGGTVESRTGTKKNIEKTVYELIRAWGRNGWIERAPGSPLQLPQEVDMIEGSLGFQLISRTVGSTSST